MSKYTHRLPPPSSDDQLVRYLADEFRRIEIALGLLYEGKQTILYDPPARPQDGMLVYADGTSWNPGSGRGLYERVGGVWSKL